MTLEFYDYNADDGLTVHSKAEEAEEEAATVLDRYRERAVAHGDWDEDVQLVEYGVVLPLGRATSHPTGAAAEPPEVNHRDYALAEVEVDAAEFWRELTERAPKLAASLAAAAPSQSHGAGPGGPESVQVDEPISRQIENMVTAHADGDLLREDFDDLRALIRDNSTRQVELAGRPPSAPEAAPMRTFSWTDGAFSRSRARAVDSSGNPLVTDQGYTLVAGPPIEQVRKGGG